MVGNWKRFGAEPLSGIYWISGSRPEVDFDENGGQFSNEGAPFVALVHIEYVPGADGCLEVEPVNQWETGGWDYSDAITHYQEFTKPEPVEQYHGVPYPPAGPGDALLRAAPKESRRKVALYLNRLYGISDQFSGDELVGLRKDAGDWLWAYARGACDFGAITEAEYRALVETIMDQLAPFQPAHAEDDGE